MANRFRQMVARMDAATVRQMGDRVLINGMGYDAIEIQFLAEMGPVTGEGLSLVIFSDSLKPRRHDVVIWKGEAYKITRQQTFNGKPQIWIE